MTHAKTDAQASASRLKMRHAALLALPLVLAGVTAGVLAARSGGEDAAMRVEQAHDILSDARATQSVAYNVDFVRAPLPHAENPADRKILFMAKLLPVVARENERILAQRLRAEKVHPGSAAFVALAREYGLGENATRAQLLTRIDAIPASLVLAQAAIESGWGTSRFAREGNAYFGERTYDPEAAGIAPENASGFKVKSFETPNLSVRSFLKTLNTHAAYRGLRERRAELRRQGVSPRGIDLAHHLGSYSEIGQDYIHRVTLTIRANELGDFNVLRLRP